MAGYGIAGGLGEGLLRVGEMAYQEQRDRANELREKRLAQYRAELDEQAAQSQHTRNLERDEAQITGQGEESRRSAEYEETLARERLTDPNFVDNREDVQAHEMELAGLRNQGSATAAELEFMERFERSHQQTTITGEYGETVTVPAGSVIDKTTNRYYVPQGNRFVLAGVEPKDIDGAAASALGIQPDEDGNFTAEQRRQITDYWRAREDRFMEAVGQNPEGLESLVEQWVGAYRYLPANIMAIMPKTR